MRTLKPERIEAQSKMPDQHSKIPTLAYATALLIGGCSGLSPTDSSGVASLAANRSSARAASWMLPQAERQDLLYVSNGNGTVTVYAYRKRTLIGTITGFQTPEGECVDQKGDVFVTDSTTNEITEYSHGATQPIMTLHDPEVRPYGCSVSPKNGDLCAANYDDESVSVYPRGKKKPRVYSTKELILGDMSCAYDDKGNMFVAGPNYDISGISQFAYLPTGSNHFIAVNPLVSSSWYWVEVRSVQWDGKFWEIASDGAWRFAIGRNGSARFEGKTTLSGVFGEAEAWVVNFKGNPRTQGSQIVAAMEDTGNGAVGCWTYPGGDSIGTITDGIDFPFGVTVSPATHD